MINGPTELVKCLAQTNLKNKGTLMEEVYLSWKKMMKQTGKNGSTAEEFVSLVSLGETWETGGVIVFSCFCGFCSCCSSSCC